MKAWEKYYKKDSELFWKQIAAKKYDYIVPVARRACKLINASIESNDPIKSHIFYKDYFEFQNNNILNGKKIAVIDDTVRYGSSLAEYRNYFESNNSHVDTYAFVGHEQLRSEPKEIYDSDMIVYKYLSHEAYQQYLLQQTLYLISRASQQDIDHLVLEITSFDISKAAIQRLENILSQWGYTYSLYPLPGIERFSLHCPSFFNMKLICQYFTSLSQDFVEKIRFHYDENKNMLFIVPMVFPKMKEGEKCPWNNLHIMDNLPCQEIIKDKNHNISKLCYISTCLYFNTILGKEFLNELKIADDDLYSKIIQSLRVKSNDLCRYFGNDLGNKLANEIKLYLLSNNRDAVISSILKGTIPKKETTPLILSNDFIPQVLTNLRKGYENKCKESKTRYKTHYTLTAEELLQISSLTHPFALSEALDDNCDFGYIVPCTENKYGYWMRTYRSGEPTPSELSIALISIAISQMGEKDIKDKNVFKAKPESAMKSLANFVFDYPAEVNDNNGYDHRYQHTLIPIKSHWGTEIYFLDTVTKNRLSLYEPERFSSIIAKHWVKNENKKTFFTTNDPSISEVETTLNKLGESAAHVYMYFKFMRMIKDITNTDDSLNALSLCRDKYWLLVHILHNLDAWTNYYGLFLGRLSTFITKRKYLLCNDVLNYLHNATREANSASKKIHYPEYLKEKWWPQIITKVNDNPLEFSTILKKIEGETKYFSLEDNDLLEISHIVNLICGFCDISFYKIGYKKELDSKYYNNSIPSFRYYNLEEKFNDVMKITDVKEMFKYFVNIYRDINSLLQKHSNISKSDAILARRNAYYSKRDYNYIAEKIREYLDNNNKCDKIAFLVVDLTKSTDEERNDYVLQQVRGRYYEVVKQYLLKYNGIYKDPEGDDQFKVLFYDISSAIRAAQEMQIYFKEKCFAGKNNPLTILAKYGIYVIEGRNNMLDMQMVNIAIALAVDCCNINKGFINEKDILTTDNTIQQIKDICIDNKIKLIPLHENISVTRQGKKYKLFRLSINKTEKKLS